MKVVVSSTFPAALRVLHHKRRVRRPVTRRPRPMCFAILVAMLFAMLLAVLFTVLFATCDGATDPTRVMEHAERSWKCRTNDNFHLWRYSKCKTILVWRDGKEATCDGATDPTRVMEQSMSGHGH